MSLGPLRINATASTETLVSNATPSSVPPSAEQEILTVSQLDAKLRDNVRSLGALFVEGEVSGCKGAGPSGHIYFTLKDEHEDACISCAMFRREAQLSGGSFVVNGSRVRVRAEATIYAPRGSLQIVVTRVWPAGLGDLLLKREELKRRLAAEGLFAAERKRSLPTDPRIVGVVTSSVGAAFFDIVKVALRRGAVRILLAPTQVQGEDAPRQLRVALQKLEQIPEVDVIIIGRGGGSAEDLAAFDDESVARAIALCSKPVVAAVGHEVDWSIACLVADVRAATPSQAAEMVAPDLYARKVRLDETQRRLLHTIRARWSEDAAVLARIRAQLRAPERALGLHRQWLDELNSRLSNTMHTQLRTDRRTYENLRRRISEQNPRVRFMHVQNRMAPLFVRLHASLTLQLAASRTRYEQLIPRLHTSMIAILERHQNQLASQAGQLHAFSPLAVLSRGYAIVMTHDGTQTRAVRSSTELRCDDSIQIRFAKGTLEARVTKIDALEHNE